MTIEKIGELISKNLIYINYDSDTIKAAILMRENNISCLVVKERGEFVGIVTEKDIINKVVAEELYPGDVKIAEIMSRDLVYVPANARIEYAAKLMRDKGIRRLVILEDDIVTGVVTETDIARIIGNIGNNYD